MASKAEPRNNVSVPDKPVAQPQTIRPAPPSPPAAAKDRAAAPPPARDQGMVEARDVRVRASSVPGLGRGEAKVEKGPGGEPAGAVKAKKARAKKKKARSRSPDAVMMDE